MFCKKLKCVIVFTLTSIITFQFHFTIAQKNGRLYFFLYYYISFLRKPHSFRVIKFHKNFSTSESHENLYIEVIEHDEHESGLNFLITIITNTISLTCRRAALSVKALISEANSCMFLLRVSNMTPPCLVGEPGGRSLRLAASTT